MADIELVIKIPEDSYKANCNGWMLPQDVENIVQGIKNGTPLPKGHGRLVDVNEVEEYLSDIQCELDGWGDTDKAIEIAKAKQGLDSITPIIEADKAESERT